jgi:hypothetical protein
MANFYSDFWKILKLDIQPFEKVKNDKAGLLFTLRLFLVVAVIATVGEFANSLASQRTSLTSALDNIATQSLEISPGCQLSWVMVSRKLLNSLRISLESWKLFSRLWARG